LKVRITAYNMLLREKHGLLAMGFIALALENANSTLITPEFAFEVISIFYSD
jgi:hypothetical protein